MGRVILPSRPNLGGVDGNIYSYEGWRAYINTPPTPRPSPLTRAEYQALSAPEQRSYDEARRRYIMNFGPLATPALDHVKRVFKHHVTADLYAPRHQIKTAFVVDGYANLGKSTLAKTIARQFELSQRMEATFPDEQARDEFIPVVHVTLRRHTTPKALAEQICNYLHIPLRTRRLRERPGGEEEKPPRKTESQLVDLIYRAVNRHDILLFVIDDIHFLSLHTADGREISKFIKSLMSSTGATFLYIGVDVEQMGFLQENGELTLDTSQTAARTIHLPIRPFKKGSRQWSALIRKAESHLPLLDHEPGTLERHAALLHNLTTGTMGSFMNLIRKTAVAAVGTTERIDQASLRRATLDYRATRLGAREEA